MPNPPQVNLPKITIPQIVGLAVAGIPILAQLLQAWGAYDVTLAQQAALSDAVQWGGAVASALFIGDAGVRIGRSVGLGKALVEQDAKTAYPPPVAANPVVGAPTTPQRPPR